MVKVFGMGGARFMTALDDDARNELGCGESPFLRTANEILRGYGDCVLPSCPEHSKTHTYYVKEMAKVFERFEKF